MLRYGLPGFRMPRKIINNEVAQLKAMGAVFKFNSRLGRDIDLDALRKTYDAVYLAVGAQKGLTSRIKGEQAKGVETALEFLKKINEGERPRIGKKVAVIGGGFTAVDSARCAVRLGAREVYILYRRTKDEMPATQEEVLEAEEEGVKVMYLVSPKAIVASKGRVKAITMVNCVLGGADASKRRRPEPVKPAEFTLPVDTVIYAVGQGVNRKGMERLKTTEWDTFAVNGDGYAGVKGVYAGGDAALGAATVIEAIATAKQAAFAIDRDLSGKAAALKPLEKTSRVKVDDILTRQGGDPRRWRLPVGMVKPEKRKGNWKTYLRAMTEKAAVAEAGRCYRCGCGAGCQICYDICKTFAWDLDGTRVNLREDDCVACGMCIWRCPNDNIEMVKTSAKPI